MKKYAKKKAAPKKRVAAKRSAPAKRRVGTKRRVAKPMSVIQGRSGQVTFSSAAHYHKANHQSARVKELASTSMSSISRQATFNCQSGQQNAVGFANIGSDDLRAILQNVANQFTGLFAAATPRGPARAVILGATQEYLFTNATEAAGTVDIYDMVLKKDLQTNWQSVINTVTYTAGANPESYWEIGLEAQQSLPTAPPVPLRNLLTVVPTDSRLFNNYFKITKKTKINMCPGATHKHVVNIKTNRMIDQLYPNFNNAGAMGFATYTMFVWSGQPVFAPPPAGDVVSAPMTLNMITSSRLKYSFVADATYSTVITTSVASALPAASLEFVSNLNGTLTSGVAGAPTPTP